VRGNPSVASTERDARLTILKIRWRVHSSRIGRPAILAVSSGPWKTRRELWRVALAHREVTEAVPDVVGNAAATIATSVVISRRESFNAAHELRNPDLSEAENQRLYGKCANLHGHNYVLEVEVEGPIDPRTGYVFDLKRLSDVISRRIIEDVDHRNLNTDVPWLEGLIPTAENLALAFLERLRTELPEGLLRRVRVWETDKNWAEVRERE
jgi:6-pyruvoyltetrahydropterin/6-carboxytetrahydropterin synthase